MNVEAAILDCDIGLFIGSEVNLPNPIGAEFDLADIYISGEGKKLESSRYLHAWDEQHETLFSEKIGIWLFSTTTKVYFLVELGRLDVITQNPSFQAIPHPDEALFFPIPAKCIKTRSVKLKTTVIYTG